MTARQAAPRRMAWAHQVPRATWLAFWLAFLAYAAIVAYAFITLPWEGSADAVFHIDYAYHVAHGEFPDPHSIDFAYGLTFNPDHHFTAAHPPLYYVASAPAAGTFIDADRWELAVVVMRGISAVCGAVTFATIAWFGWQFGGRYRDTLAVALPAVSTLSVPFVRFSAEAYNDVPVTMFAALAITVAAHIVRDGPRRGRMISLAAIAVLGVATKATFIIVLGVVLAGVVAAVIIHGHGSMWRRLRRGVLLASPVLAAPILAMGWFYWWNYQRSGSPVRAFPKFEHLGREYLDLGELLTNADFYGLFFARALGNNDWGWPPTNFAVSLAVSIVSALAAVVALALHRPWRGERFRVSAVIGAMVAAVLLGVYVAQGYQAIGYGTLNFRYLLPASIAFGFMWGWGWLALGRRWSIAIPVQMLILGAGTVFYTMWYLETRLPHKVRGASFLDLVHQGAVANDLPAALPWALLGVFAAACASLAWALPRTYR